MVKKCPPGVICIENVVFMFFGFLLLSILYFMYIKYENNKNNTICSVCNTNNNKCECKKNTNLNIYNNSENLIPRNGFSFTNNQNDILLNPYSAPLRDDRIYNNSNLNGIKIPINVPTQSFDTSYRQIGILTRVNGGETILPLMGRPLFSNRDKWNFYTMNDKNTMIKLPISFKNRSCTSEMGCDNLYNGDTVHVEGFNDIFRVTIYDNNVMQYIPFL
jgi:hypothetical protein